MPEPPCPSRCWPSPLGDSLPTPLYAVDGPQVAYTVEQYMDSTVTAWRAGAGVEVEPIVEDIPDGMVAVLIVPRAGEDQSTGVESLPSGQSSRSQPATAGAGGFSLEEKWTDQGSAQDGEHGVPGAAPVTTPR